MKHNLKIWPNFYEDVASNKKTHEVRKDDRPFSVGDTIIFSEWDPLKEEYTGQSSEKTIKHITHMSEIPVLVRQSWGLNPCPHGFLHLVIISLDPFTE